MDEYHPLSAGEVVQVKPTMTPIGMSFAEGESLRVRLIGIDQGVYPPVDQSTLTVEGLEQVNDRGSIVLHSHAEGDLESYIVLQYISYVK